jgi:hypothetical protein
MLPVSTVLCLVPNVIRVYLSVFFTQCYTCLSFCVLCPMLPVCIFLCLVPNVARVYLSVSCAECFQCLSRVTLDTGYTKIDTGNIGHKKKKDRHG